MILQSKTTTNGYGCGCCTATYYDTDWIEEKDAIPENELFEIAKKAHPYDKSKYDLGEWNNICYFSYEKDGKFLYGFSISYGRMKHHVTFTHSDGTESKEIQAEWEIEREKKIEKADKAKAKRDIKAKEKAEQKEYERLKKKYEDEN
ncbi:MAG: hypothetical protein ACTSQA_01135 [Candidatus Heimdallarchaeaceae archaeon]